ncbi:MAG: 4-(cytidine 5'-diphospho)-2-C-methyl-D-erythritol kinase, partial [Planctomycetes bacterium RBG_16_59_8]
MLVLIRRGSALAIRSPAKVNLFLEVLRRRPDGYHELSTVMHAVSLFDTLTFRRAGEDRLSLGRGSLPVPVDGTNTIWKAVAEMRRRLGMRGGLQVSLIKRIPSGAGLGGGSGNAAAAILACDRLFRLKLTGAEMADIGAAVGSDVPFFFGGGSALCGGRGERICVIPHFPAIHLVLLVPAVRKSTAEVYNNLEREDLTGRRKNVKLRLNRMEKTASGGAMANAVSSLLWNRLESPALRLFPGLMGIKERMARAFPLGASMTGSGTAFFGL